MSTVAICDCCGEQVNGNRMGKEHSVALETPVGIITTTMRCYTEKKDLCTACVCVEVWKALEKHVASIGR